LPDLAPDRAEIAFWPRRASAHRARFVEHDLFVTVSAAGRPVLDLMVEVKWDAPFGEGQLAAQWRSVSPGERSRTVHVILVRHLAQAVRGMGRGAGRPVPAKRAHAALRDGGA
jgi:hypothetical protein